MLGLAGDVQLSGAPKDTVTRLVFDAPRQRLLATSWDGSAYLYALPNAGTPWSQPGQAYRSKDVQEEALLDGSFHELGDSFYAGGCTGAVWKFDVNRPDTGLMIGTHSMPVKACRYNDLTKTVITAGWDRQICVWDDRSSTPVTTIQMPERVYALDVKQHRLVVSTADRQVMIFDVASGAPRHVETRTTPLTQAHRCVSIFSDLDGFIVGSVEGRCAVQYFGDGSRNFAFKCHRDTQYGMCRVSAVNDIAFSRWNTFATIGSDGIFNFWCQARRQRLKAFAQLSTSLTACAFSPTDDMFAYATGTDWSQGGGFSQPNRVAIFLHASTEGEIRKQR